MTLLLKKITIVCLVSICSTSFAQVLKFGHINSALLVTMMPESKSADSALDKYSKDIENQLTTMTAEFNAKRDDYRMKMADLSDIVRAMKEKELGDLQSRIADFRDSANEAYQKKKESIYQPIFKKASEAIHALAKEGGFSYIFDSSYGFLLYAPDSDDVMELVKKKLGIEIPTPQAPNQAPPKN